MKKLKFNSTLNHKQSDYKTREVIVEKVITVYDKSFSELKGHPMRDNSYIAENRDLMYIDSNDTAHCLLMVDYDSGDGILVEAEGSRYARKSQFIPNARALIENNELTVSEQKLHNSLKKWLITSQSLPIAARKVLSLMNFLKNSIWTLNHCCVILW